MGGLSANRRSLPKNLTAKYREVTAKTHKNQKKLFQPHQFNAFIQTNVLFSVIPLQNRLKKNRKYTTYERIVVIHK